MILFGAFFFAKTTHHKTTSCFFPQGRGDSAEIDDLTEEWRARLWPGLSTSPTGILHLHGT